MESSPVFVVSPGSLIHLLASDSRQRQEEANNCVNSDLTNGGWPIPTHHPTHTSSQMEQGGNCWYLAPQTLASSYNLICLICSDCSNLVKVKTNMEIVFFCVKCYWNCGEGYCLKCENNFIIKQQQWSSAQSADLPSYTWVATELPLDCQTQFYDSWIEPWASTVRWIIWIRNERSIKNGANWHNI